MIDFTLNAYKCYLGYIKKSYSNIITFSDFFLSQTKPSSFCIIRHDVDRKPYYALRIAETEFQSKVRSSYYFRVANFKNHEIIRRISDMGHEIGFHYESLSKCGGNIEKALFSFNEDLTKLRSIFPVTTIAMHGNPLSKFNELDLWENSKNINFLHEKLKIIGEVSLDVDYANIAYITDTGRNWQSQKNNKFDKVDSEIICNFTTSSGLIECFKEKTFPKLVFSTHPERWTNNFTEYIIQYCKDQVINFAKKIS